jgi:hypothetical protein
MLHFNAGPTSASRCYLPKPELIKETDNTHIKMGRFTLTLSNDFFFVRENGALLQPKPRRNNGQQRIPGSPTASHKEHTLKTILQKANIGTEGPEQHREKNVDRKDPIDKGSMLT